MTRDAPPAVVDAQAAQRALAALRAAVGAQWVFDTANPELDNYRDAYRLADDHAQRPLAAVLPANLKQIQKTLAIARRYKLALWPISTGRNLGYGGAAPLNGGAVMLDLQRMKRVLEVNEQHAYAVVEAGASYLALHSHLKKIGSQLWLDPTASGWGGPLANFLERGVGYTPYGQHSDTQCGMQMLLADGTVVETASGHAKTRCLYRYGQRAWVDGLFNQANFGIVTRIGVHLMPAPAGYRPYLITLRSDEALHACIEALRPLCLAGVLQARTTLMSQPRAAAYGTTRAAWQSAAGPLRDEALAKLMAALELGQWNLYGALYGAEPVLNSRWRVIENAVRAIPGAGFHFAATRARDAAFKCRAALLGGTPSMDEYHTLDWVGAGAHLDFSAVLPFAGDSALAACHTARNLCHAHGFDYSAEFQLEARSLRHEVRIVFERDVATRQRAAHSLHAALAAHSVRDGHGSPRAHLAFMDDTAMSYSWHDHTLRRAHEALKDVLDPHGVIAPGKSGLWPGRYVQRKKS